MKLSSNFFQKGGLGDTTKNKNSHLKRTKIKLEILAFVSERLLFLLYLCTQVRSSLKTLTPYFELLEFTDICEVDKMKKSKIVRELFKKNSS